MLTFVSMTCGTVRGKKKSVPNGTPFGSFEGKTYLIEMLCILDPCFTR